MLSDITNSIKAKLYDFTYTPFMSSMIISWIILNHKYLLIYFGNSKLNEKLTHLNEYDFSASIFGQMIPYAMNVWFPILFGLFYVFAYPWASERFYKYTLERTKALKEIKQKIEDVTPVTQEEARQIRQDITRLTVERDELRERAIKAETYYKDLYQKQAMDLTHPDNDWGDSKPNNPEEDSNFQDKQTKDNDNSADTKEAEDVEKIENHKDKILRFFYESNYKTKTESQVLDSIVQKTGIRRPKAQKVLDTLVSEKILERGSDSLKYISLTGKGNNLLIDMFDEEE